MTTKKNSKKKTFVLDKSVLLYNPYALFAFDDNDVVVPVSVFRELAYIAEDEHGDMRANAKEVGLLLDELSTQGDIRAGVPLPSGGSITVSGEYDEQTAIIYARVHAGSTVVTRDPYQRVEANLAGVPAEDYKSDQAPIGNKIYEGRCCLYVSPEEIEIFSTQKSLRLMPGKEYAAFRMDKNTLISDNYQLTLHEYIILVNSANPKQTMLGFFDGKEIRPLRYYQGKNSGQVYGVEPRNVGQIFALDALLAPPNIAPLVILKGPAGTAKTFLTMAAALAQTIDNWGGDDGTRYRKILLTRPNAKMDEDIGFLKGDEQDKIMPVLRGFIDNVDNLSSKSDYPEQTTKDGIQTGSVLDTLISRGTIDMQAMAYMRGRSIKRQFICCDEMQNATITQVLSIVTRVSDGSKIVLCGDTDQIDHPMLDKRTNGIAYAADRMRGAKTCWQLTFDESECERGELAAEAIARMKPKGSF